MIKHWRWGGRRPPRTTGWAAWRSWPPMPKTSFPGPSRATRWKANRRRSMQTAKGD